MPPLNWNAFEHLPGDASTNWESLCRELVRRSYGRFGSFRSIKQQPGIEFNLVLERECDLGGPPEHWGWQCRWYRNKDARSLNAPQRKKIELAIETTARHYPEITHWVLWTR